MTNTVFNSVRSSLCICLCRSSQEVLGEEIWHPRPHTPSCLLGLSFLPHVQPLQSHENTCQPLNCLGLMSLWSKPMDYVVQAFVSLTRLRCHCRPRLYCVIALLTVRAGTRELTCSLDSVDTPWGSHPLPSPLLCHLLFSPYTQCKHLAENHWDVRLLN